LKNIHNIKFANLKIKRIIEVNIFFLKINKYIANITNN